MSNTVIVLFFISWFICGCCLDAIFENPAAMVIVMASVIIAIGCTVQVIKGMKEGV